MGKKVPKPKRPKRALVGQRLPVLWARLGGVSNFLVQRYRPQSPPVLVLSQPRSGSSWLGETLGRATNALYLREPLTQADGTSYSRDPIFSPESREGDTKYGELADKAFMAWPDFGRHIVIFPRQWALRWRRTRHLVIKEVNPLACGWFIRRYEPRLVYLVRHPAGVALSYHKYGWPKMEPDAMEKFGERQASALRTALDVLEEYDLHTVVQYEDLCSNPVAEFQRLYDFAGLIWNDQMKAYVEHRSRNSARMIGAWRPEFHPDALAALRAGYSRFDVPWYQNDEQW